MDFEIADRKIAPGTREDFELPVARLVTQNMVNLPVAVVHGKRPGPRLFVTAAVHGDELNGTEIARRLLARVRPERISGTLVVLPVVNVLGFIQGTRLLPDKRDLNRQFPGSAKGSMASLLAHLVMQEVVQRCTHGVDLHGGSNHRTNLPQIRADFQDTKAFEMCNAFGAPVALHAKMRSGSLRSAAGRVGVPVVVYEAGEPQRFEEASIRTGINGLLRVMAHLGMARAAPKPRRGALTSRSSRWIRASRSGIVRMLVKLGARTVAGRPVAEIGDTFGNLSCLVYARHDGIVIGLGLNPIVNRGDALVHVATIDVTV